MDFQRLYELDCGIRHYDWGTRGSPGKPPFIASLRGVPADGRPFAELWIGDHPAMPSVVTDYPGKPSLHTLIREVPDTLLGPPSGRWNGPALPFLLKVLSCERPLSIQAHPDRALARRLHRRDPEHYPDANHKPEVAVAVTPFEALALFRPLPEIRAEVARLDPLRRFLQAIPDDADWLRQAFRRLLLAPAAEVEAAIHAIANRLPSPSAGHDALFRRCAEFHPGDRGVLSVYFLNHLRLAPGQAFCIPPCEPHAYLSGTVVECMATSDNVVRAGLTGKFVDGDVLLEMLSYRDGPPRVLEGEKTGPGITRYRCPRFAFELEFLRPEQRMALSSDEGVSLLLVLEGTVRFLCPRCEILARRGTVWLWPAVAETLRLEPVDGSRPLLVRASPASLGVPMPGQGRAPRRLGKRLRDVPSPPPRVRRSAEF
ncbi:MAG: mannose-6-phosphate isomerase, class I [Lentisphaeria bacterium]|nr:mannose-6-phosphate isomerase, class I [Lentisphaeria bacterium]